MFENHSPASHPAIRGVITTAPLYSSLVGEGGDGEE